MEKILNVLKEQLKDHPEMDQILDKVKNAATMDNIKDILAEHKVDISSLLNSDTLKDKILGDGDDSNGRDSLLEKAEDLLGNLFKK